MEIRKYFGKIRGKKGNLGSIKGYGKLGNLAVMDEGQLCLVFLFQH